MTSLADRIKQRRQQSGVTPALPTELQKKQTQSLPLGERINKILETLKLRNYDQVALAEELRNILSDNKISCIDLAKKINKSQSWVSKRLAILSAPVEIQHKIRSGELAVNGYYESSAERVKKFTMLRKQAIDHAKLFRDIGIKFGLNIELSQKPSNKEINAAFARIKEIRSAILK